VISTVDDCWSIKSGRDNTTKRLLPDLAKFPDGINGTAAKIHDMGLKIGIYSDAGKTTCGGHPGSLYFEDIDAATWAEWGIDCIVPLFQLLVSYNYTNM
jgi:alpha-galactosidase